MKRRGPRKLQPLDLRQDIAGLHHGGRRTAATCGLAQTYRESLSRRQLGELVRQARQEQRQRTRAAVQCRVVWHRTARITAPAPNGWICSQPSGITVPAAS